MPFVRLYDYMVCSSMFIRVYHCLLTVSTYGNLVTKESQFYMLVCVYSSLVSLDFISV